MRVMDRGRCVGFQPRFEREPGHEIWVRMFSELWDVVRRSVEFGALISKIPLFSETVSMLLA